jgi:hypothetical protein
MKQMQRDKPINVTFYERAERERFELSRVVTPWMFSKHLH